MNVENKNKIELLFVMVAFMLGIFLASWYTYHLSNNPTVKTETQIQLVYDISDPFSEQKVKDYLLQLHVKFPEVALAQMKLESANGTSKIFKENNNLFGMRKAIRRPTTALGEKNNHAYYSHWRQSILDYALWSSFVSNTENMDSEEAWLQYIGRNYAEDNSYINKLRKIIKNK